MIKKINLLILILLAIFFVACECVPDINTKKVVEPSEFAKVMFINSMPDYDSVDICSSDKLISRNLLYDSAYTDYKVIASGITSLRIQNYKDSSIIFNTMVELIKDERYTFIAYGTKSKINGLLIQDSTSQISPSNAYIRFIHLSPDAPDVNFSFDSYQINQPVKYKSYTTFMPIPTGIFTLIVRDSGTGNEITRVDNYDFKTGKLYNLILKGYYLADQPRKLRCDIIEFVIK